MVFENLGTINPAKKKSRQHVKFKVKILLSDKVNE